jgi:cyclopropane-fatty-acyl-phospholipid synthase
MSQTIGSSGTLAASRERQASEITQNLLTRLFGKGKQHTFAVRLWDGETLPAGTGVASPFKLVLTHPGSLRRMFSPPGELTLAEAYLGGDFDIEGDIFAAMGLAGHFESFSPRDWLDLARSVRSLPTTDPPEKYQLGRQRARLKGVRHSRARDRAAIAYHYNVGNDFYALFLGRWMAYSCGYFTTHETDLDSAQATKFEHICRKLRLNSGDRLLDIGCGWGGLLVYAAENYGVQARGITLSQPQVEYAQAWVQRARLTDQVRVELRDYRDLDEKEQFDKIVSVGMFEHVGRSKLPEYFKSAWRALKPGGLFLNHGIAAQGRRAPGWIERTVFQSGEFTQRYVFPDGELVPISDALAFAEKAGFEVRDVESLREHYALTLRHWVQNLEEHHDRAVQIKDERTYRTWRMYLAASAYGFEAGQINVFQALLSKNREGLAGLPLTRADLYRSKQLQ